MSTRRREKSTTTFWAFKGHLATVTSRQKELKPRCYLALHPVRRWNTRYNWRKQLTCIRLLLRRGPRLGLWRGSAGKCCLLKLWQVGQTPSPLRPSTRRIRPQGRHRWPCNLARHVDLQSNQVRKSFIFMKGFFVGMNRRKWNYIPLVLSFSQIIIEWSFFFVQFVR